MTKPFLLSVEDLTRTYPSPSGDRIIALDGLSFDLERGRSLGIVGASGAGKSTLTRLLLGLEPPDSGRILIEGEDLNAGSSRHRRRLRMKLQAVFQDPRSSLNPDLTVGRIVEEPLLARFRLSRAERRRRIERALESLDLDPALRTRRPTALSGGQRQRVAIARALVCDPEILILDEPVSALDGPVRTQILALLASIQAKRDLTIVLVSHDVRTIEAMTDRLIVLYAGRVMETGPTESVLEAPRHPYTRVLLDAVPSRTGKWSIPETVVDQKPATSGCSCRTWCPSADDRCPTVPALEPADAPHQVACWVVQGLRSDDAFAEDRRD